MGTEPSPGAHPRRPSPAGRAAAKISARYRWKASSSTAQPGPTAEPAACAKRKRAGGSGQRAGAGGERRSWGCGHSAAAGPTVARSSSARAAMATGAMSVPRGGPSRCARPVVRPQERARHGGMGLRAVTGSLSASGPACPGLVRGTGPRVGGDGVRR